MRKIVLLLILFFSYYISNAQQRFKAGVKMGLVTSQVEGDTYEGFAKVGFTGGAYVRGTLNKKWTAQFEIIYLQKGSKHEPNGPVGDVSSYKLQLDYIEVPVLFQYHRKKLIGEFGPSFSYLIRAKERVEDNDISGAYPFNTKEVSLNIGINYTMKKNFSINLRYTNSITTIRNKPAITTSYLNKNERNNVLALSLMYQLGKPEKDK